MCCDSKAQRKGSPTVCPDCCVFHQGEFLNITRTCHVQRITIILHSSVGPHASSNHPDPEIMDIYSAAITDKREWNGENGRTESVMGLLFKDGHYRERNLNQKYDLGRQWENKNQDIRLKKKTCERQRRVEERNRTEMMITGNSQKNGSKPKDKLRLFEMDLSREWPEETRSKERARQRDGMDVDYCHPGQLVREELAELRWHMPASS